MTIPKKLDDITPEWLSDALGRKITAVRASRSASASVSSARCSG